MISIDMNKLKRSQMTQLNNIMLARRRKPYRLKLTGHRQWPSTGRLSIIDPCSVSKRRRSPASSSAIGLSRFRPTAEETADKMSTGD